MRWRVLMLVLPLLLAVPAKADGFDYREMARNLGISEFRAGVMLHGVELQAGIPLAVRPDTIDVSNWQNLNAEVLFDLPDNALTRLAGSPRLGLGATLNFVGKDSYVRLASVWHVPVFDTGLFFEPMLGGMVHNGYLSDAPAGRRNLGCRALYFYGANFGYNVSDAVTAMVTMEHGSHYAQCGATTNDGINRIGLRLGWKLK